jgi:hypothetical protein
MQREVAALSAPHASGIYSTVPRRIASATPK